MSLDRTPWMAPGRDSAEEGSTLIMQIVSTAATFPEHYHSQEALLEALQQFWGDRIDNPNVLRRLHRHVGVDGRYLSIPKKEYLTMKTWGEANRHWIRNATELGGKLKTHPSRNQVLLLQSNL